MILNLFENWFCPNCGKTERIPAVAGPHTRFHTCPKLAMLTAPMLPEGTKAKVVAHEREDYEGADSGHLTLNADGRPIMNVETVRENGNDLIVFAATATGSAEAIGIHPTHITGAATAAGSGTAN